MKHDLRPKLPLFGNRGLGQYDRYLYNLHAVSISKMGDDSEFTIKCLQWPGHNHGLSNLRDLEVLPPLSVVDVQSHHVSTNLHTQSDQLHLSPRFPHK